MTGMKQSMLATLTVMCVAAGCASATPHVCEKASAAAKAAVAHDARPAEDRARDAHRHPASVLEFAGVGPGLYVLDLAAGGGYYSEILANAVGEKGRVIMHNSPWLVNKFGDMGVPERLKKPNMANVMYLEQKFDELELATNSVDVAMMVLFYHDTYWQKVDRAAMNQSIFDALVPGGAYVVIDHHAEAGSGARDVETLHRIGAEEVMRDVLAAGFEFHRASDVLRHPEDDRTLGVFDPRIRGETDRFVYRFRKPKAP